MTRKIKRAPGVAVIENNGIVFVIYDEKSKITDESPVVIISDRNNSGLSAELK